MNKILFPRLARFAVIFLPFVSVTDFPANVIISFCACFRFVANQMGGPIDKGNFSGFSWELHISQIKYELRSNVIPIGKIEAGIHYHRALLFKVVSMSYLM